MPIPKSMKECKLVTLSKTKEPIVCLDDIRPICVFDCRTKLLEQGILKTLEDVAANAGVEPLLSIEGTY